MAKALFRFLRGELNGFYITNIHDAMNHTTQEYKKFFIDFNSIQFEAGKIDNETLYNLGRFAGIFLPRIPQGENISSVRMTESEYDQTLNYEFSERGLFKTDDEDFEFVQKVIDDTGLPDINTLATDTKRSSLVGTESVEGYVSQDETDVIDDNGDVDPEKVSPTPPQDTGYSDYYGNKFLFLSEGDTKFIPVSYDLFLYLFKAIQYVRYNGGTIVSLAKIVEVLCPQGLVTISDITVADSKNRWLVSYATDLTVDIDLKQDRIDMLLYIIRTKFPQVQMVEEL